MHEIKNKQKEINQLCIKYKVLQLFVFGSMAKENYRKDSDIDLLVYFVPDIPIEEYGDNFFDFIYDLEKLFNRKIDLVSGKAMKNPYFISEVEQTKKIIYDHATQKIIV